MNQVCDIKAYRLTDKQKCYLPFISALTVLIAVTIGIGILNPLWSYYAPYLEQLDLLPAISAPVDGLSYLNNAQFGYRWNTKEPLSLLFHPALSTLLAFLPSWLPNKIWFWLISILFAFGSLLLIYRLTYILAGTHPISTKVLPLCLIAPGGLILGTGNAEIPCLFFATALLLSVLHWQKWGLTISCALLAIMTKPNALYMVPVLFLYAMWSHKTPFGKVQKHALGGIFVILGGWAMWMLFVDWQAGELGTYWNIRMSFNPGVAGTFSGFFERMARSFIYDGDLRNQIRYTVAIVVPIMSLAIYGLIPVADDQHRYAMAAGVLTMMAIALFQGNPNKILVYSTTLPGHFTAHILLMVWLSSSDLPQNKATRRLLGLAYMIYCFGMLLVFVLGTPLGWYH